MAKRKAAKKEAKPEAVIGSAEETALPRITVTEIPPPDVGKEIDVRCVWDSRLIVGGNKTVTGKRYEFLPGETKPVDILDYQALLDLHLHSPGCCGQGPTTQRYFEET